MLLIVRFDDEVNMYFFKGKIKTYHILKEDIQTTRTLFPNNADPFKAIWSFLVAIAFQFEKFQYN